MPLAAKILITRRAAAQCQPRRDAVGEVDHCAQGSFGEIAIDSVIAGQADQRAVLHHHTGVKSGLPRRQLAAANIDDAGLFRPITARAIEHQPDDIASAHQRDIVELITALGLGAFLAGPQHIVDVKLDIIANRQFAAQIDALEHAGLLLPLR